MMRLFRSQMSKLSSVERRYCTNVNANDEVLFEVKNDVGIITLNRPKVLNSLNIGMIRSIYSRLKKWERDCSFIVVRGNGDKAFCAGGDVVAAVSNPIVGKEFFREEYKMNYLIANYRIPYISILDGITMGGGVGLSVHGSFRIATEKTLFAMPETAIGLFPDVGGTYFLPRLPGRLGMFLGLTGTQMRGVDVVKSGIATHFVESAHIPKFVDKLINEADPYSLYDFLKKNTVDLSHFPLSLINEMDNINVTFASETVHDIMRGLYFLNIRWATECAEQLATKSPVSLRITKQALDLGSKLTLKDCLKMEYRLACAALDKKISPDFYEGVRALLIDKDKSPRWQPNYILDLSDETIFEAFKELPPSEELDI